MPVYDPMLNAEPELSIATYPYVPLAICLALAKNGGTAFPWWLVLRLFPVVCFDTREAFQCVKHCWIKICNIWTFTGIKMLSANQQNTLFFFVIQQAAISLTVCWALELERCSDLYHSRFIDWKPNSSCLLMGTITVINDFPSLLAVLKEVVLVDHFRCLLWKLGGVLYCVLGKECW